MGESQLPISPTMIELSGGVDAPSRARRWALSCLTYELADACEDDVAIIVTELVTNSVVHAHVGASQLLTVSVARLTDGVRIAVADNGSPALPHLRQTNDGRPGGNGLRIIDQLCPAWGVTRNDSGATEVWCDLPSDPVSTHQL